MNVFKRYNYHKTGIRHGGATGVRTSDAAAIERFQQKQAIASRANVSRRGFVWKAKWNTEHGKATSSEEINKLNAIFWAKQNGRN